MFKIFNTPDMGNVFGDSRRIAIQDTKTGKTFTCRANRDKVQDAVEKCLNDHANFRAKREADRRRR